MGGNIDKTGSVDKNVIRAVIEQFELTIDIQEFLDQVSQPWLDFHEFCTLFDQPFDDTKSHLSLRSVYINLPRSFLKSLDLQITSLSSSVTLRSSLKRTQTPFLRTNLGLTHRHAWSESLIRVLGEGLLCHDVVEIFKRNVAITIAVCSLDHLSEFGFVHGFSQLFGDSGETLLGDDAGAAFVEDAEDLADVFFGVAVGHPGRHQVEELFELDRAAVVRVQVRDHLVYSLVSRLQTQAIHRLLQFFRVDRASAVGVEQVERLLYLVDLFFLQSWLLVVLGVELWLLPSFAFHEN